MKSSALVAAFRLARPRQWPILTAQLAVGAILALPSATAGPGLSVTPLAVAWLAWVVLLNGGTLAFNSAYDRDTGPIAYLKQPPAPPAGLAGWSLGAMLLGVVIGWLGVGPVFGWVVLGSVVLSVLYSHSRTRWKSRPGLDLLVNMVGYGGGTTLAGLAAGRAAGLGVGSGCMWYVAGFACLFGSLYPSTQIYQIDDDIARGDRTLATALGLRPVLGLALFLGVVAAALLMAGVGTSAAPSTARAALAVSLALWNLHLAWWWWRAPLWEVQRHERGMYHALVLWALVDVTLAWLKLA